MIDLEGKISAFGHIDNRAKEAIEYLKKGGYAYGEFDHNTIQIIVYSDSTIREIGWQYDCKCLQRRQAR